MLVCHCKDWTETKTDDDCQNVWSIDQLYRNMTFYLMELPTDTFNYADSFLINTDFIKFIILLYGEK